MTHFVKATVLAGVLVAAAACSTGAVQSVKDNTFRYTPNQVNYATSGGEVRTVILGNPFAMPKSAFDDSVTAHMDGRPQWSSYARYTTRPSAEAQTAYHVAMAFNPPVNYDGDDVCASRDSAAGAMAAGFVRVVAAFCSTDEKLTDTLVTSGGIRRPAARPQCRRQRDIEQLKGRHQGCRLTVGIAAVLVDSPLRADGCDRFGVIRVRFR